MAKSSTARLGKQMAALLVVCSTVVACAPSQRDSSSRFAPVERAVESAMTRHAVPGVSVAIVDDYEVVYSKEFGFAEPGRPVTSQTLFQAASLSKPVAAVVAGEAAEAGLISLEADVTDLLTSWRLPPSDFEEPPTIRTLLAHRAGVNVPGFPGYRMDETLPALPQILNGVRNKNEPIRVVTEPGLHEYSGGGYLIAELAIEDATARRFEELAETLVFDPLRLELSTFEILDGADRSRVAVGYRAIGSEVAGGGWHLYPETSAGSMWTTAPEYAAIVIDVMHSYTDGTGRVLDQTTARLLLDPDFAVGFGVSREPEGISIGHDGSNEGYRTRFVALPLVGEGVVILTNSDTGDALTPLVIDEVSEILHWPGSGWSTPLWAVIVGFVVLAALAAVLVARMRRRGRGLQIP